MSETCDGRRPDAGDGPERGGGEVCSGDDEPAVQPMEAEVKIDIFREEGREDEDDDSVSRKAGIATRNGTRDISSAIIFSADTHPANRDILAVGCQGIVI